MGLNHTIGSSITRNILRNRIILLGMILAMTAFMISQWKFIRFSFTEANLLPDNHPITQLYNQFRAEFGEEGNSIVIGLHKSEIFSPKVFEEFKQMMDSLNTLEEVTFSISLDNLKIAVNNSEKQKLELQNLIDSQKPISSEYLAKVEKQLFEELPFYNGLIYNSESGYIRSILYMDNDIVNKKERKDFVINKLNPLIEAFEKKTNVNLHVSGMPYIRTMNSQSVVDEIGLLIGGALGVTSLIFFIFFRSLRATFISIVVVVIGVMWSFGTIGFFNYELTLLTAIIPPLIIVIGIPNCIFLINKYQSEFKSHGNRAKSLTRVITKIGNATLYTNLTTAAGFGTFITANNKLLNEFGLVASINIVLLFILSIIIIPIYYSYLPLPKKRHLEHLEKKRINTVINYFEKWVLYDHVKVFAISIIVLVISAIGITQMEVIGSIVEDMPRNTTFHDDILFYEKEFNGIMPLEIVVDTKRKNGATKPRTLKKIEQLQETIEETPELSKPISIVNLIKYAKQAYYNGIPEYYELPTSQEKSFIGSYIKRSVQSEDNLLKNYVDSTGQKARITTFMKDMPTKDIEVVEKILTHRINHLFPEEKYNVYLTGKALLFQKGTTYLIRSLLVSLALAILIIALLITYMFRSYKMVIISLLPNLLPLVITAGMMGYIGIPLKPSTILVFSIAFGISVDDTIHFLVKYRQELQSTNWKIKKSVIAALRESGISMFYTSVVLFFGFSVFMISDFGGTVALGGLVSATLLFAMFSNLILLPTLLLVLEKKIANKEVFVKPRVKIMDRFLTLFNKK